MEAREEEVSSSFSAIFTARKASKLAELCDKLNKRLVHFFSAPSLWFVSYVSCV